MGQSGGSTFEPKRFSLPAASQLRRAASTPYLWTRCAGPHIARGTVYGIGLSLQLRRTASGLACSCGGQVTFFSQSRLLGEVPVNIGLLKRAGSSEKRKNSCFVPLSKYRTSTRRIDSWYRQLIAAGYPRCPTENLNIQRSACPLLPYTSTQRTQRLTLVRTAVESSKYPPARVPSES